MVTIDIAMLGVKVKVIFVAVPAIMVEAAE